MRELNTNEVSVVSGAGFVTNITGGIGSFVGTLVNIVPNIFKLGLDFRPSFKAWGQAVGSLITFDLKGAGTFFKNGFDYLIKKPEDKPADKPEEKPAA